MSLPNGADVNIGGIDYLLDEGYIQETGRRCYVHGGQTILADDLIGTPGQNLRNDRLRWFITNFNGEGQVVFNRDDPDSAGLFYQSEGIDFKTAGQGRLNKSSIAEQANVSAAGSTTKEGNADFTDITGSSSTSGTDRRLNAVGNKIGHTASITPGAVNMQGDFYLYREAFADYATTILGSALHLYDGDGKVSGSTFILTSEGSTARTAGKDSGTAFTVGDVQRVEFYLHRSASGPKDMYARVQVVNVTNGPEEVISTKLVIVTGAVAPSSPTVVLNFTPKTGRTYQFRITYSTKAETTTNLVADKIIFGDDITENTATIEVWNQTGGVSVATKVVAVSTAAVFGVGPGALVGSITWQGVAATDYRLRVARTAGNQRIIVDKTVTTAKGNALFVYDCLDFGAGQKVWLGGHVAAADTHGWVYNPSTDAWDDTLTLNDGASTTAATVLAMTHSDSLEYFLLNNNEIYTGSTSVTDDRYARFSASARTLVGMVICQERLVVMAEDSSGVIVYSMPVDLTGATSPATPLDLATDTTNVSTITISAGSKTADTTLRQRMCSTPTGARLFLNFADVTAKVYEVDTSVSPITYRQLADLGIGVKATSIAYEGGLTFVAGQFYGDATASDTDKLPRAALWVIDQNGYTQRIGFMRRYSPDPRVPQFMAPYQTDLFMQQGNYVWRYSLVTGGLFLEYQLSPATPANERALATLFGRTFSLFSDEIWVTGSVATYRQSSASGGNSYTTSINDMGLPGTLKTLTKITLMTDDLPSNTQVAVSYFADGSATENRIGTASAGTKNIFFTEAVVFTTIQFKVTLSSFDGVSTPTWKALEVEAKAAEENESFDLVLLTADRVSGGDKQKIIVNDTSTGLERAQSLAALWRVGTATTLIDGYNDIPGETESYLVTVGDFRDERNERGEGRVVVTLNVVR